MKQHNEKIVRWSAQENGGDYIAINTFLEYLGQNLYYDYEPSIGPFPDYYSRLIKWLENVEDEKDQQNLLRIANLIFYVGREEFNSLYRTAYQTNFIRWIIEMEGLSLNDPQIIKKIEAAKEAAWFCPVTDSLRINQFYHLNQIQAVHEFRPDWRSLREFGDPEKIKKYIKENNIKYIILLEDFVGSGTQSWKSIKFACELDPQIKILLLPLIICPQGIKKITDEVGNMENFNLSPVLVLSESAFIAKENTDGEDALITVFREIINQAEPKYVQKGIENHAAPMHPGQESE